MTTGSDSQPAPLSPSPLSIEHRSDPFLRNRRVLWLRHSPDPLPETTQALQVALTQAGCLVQVTDPFTAGQMDVAHVDLILLDGFENLDGVIETVLARIRFESQAPVIVLSSGHSTEQLVAALVAGADAIWSVDTPVALFLVRCKALLRRWKGSPS